MRIELNCFYWRRQEQEQKQTYRLPSSSAILPPALHRGGQHHVCVLQDNGKAYTLLQPKARQSPQHPGQCCCHLLGDCKLSLVLAEAGQDIHLPL